VAAHIAIRLDIQKPQPDQQMGSASEAVVFAQAMLAGVDHVAFSASLDGRPVDPASGEFTPQPVSTETRVSTSMRIPLRRLTPGKHRFEISYRPDSDEPIRQTSVDFMVRKRHPSPILGIGLAAAALAAGAALVFRLRRRS